MLYEKDANKFKKWLIDRGAEILAPTNQYEVIRFKSNNKLGIVYKKGSGFISKVVGEAEKAYAAYVDKKPYSCNEVKKRIRRGVVFETLLKRDGNNCFYCGIEMADGEETIEHLFSINQGGKNHINNLALAHQKCNLLAANKSVVEKIKLRDQLRGNANAS